jgi:DNA-binding response OmpR family regulator
MLRERILIVEDEPDLRPVFVDILTSAGFDTRTASDGEMAIQMLGDNNYDLSLIDLYLPKMDSFQVPPTCSA